MKSQMIEIRHEHPINNEHFSRLLDFYRDISAICQELGIEPILSGSLAVFGYTKNQAMRVNDIDLACSVLDFPRLTQALKVQGIDSSLKEWHVLQTRRDDLKVEFDSREYWFKDLPAEYHPLVVNGCAFTVVSLSNLQELYRRGLEATSVSGSGDQRAKHSALAEKYAALCSLRG